MRASCVEDAGSEAGLLSQEEALLVAARLHRVLRPFVLRRLKESVATELLPKVHEHPPIYFTTFCVPYFPSCSTQESTKLVHSASWFTSKPQINTIHKRMIELGKSRCMLCEIYVFKQCTSCESNDPRVSAGRLVIGI